MEITHYTLNTTNSLTQTPTMDNKVRAVLKPHLTRGLREGVTEFKVPSFEDYTAKLTVVGECALFDVYGPDRDILTTNAIAWSKEGQAAIWADFETFYLKMSRDLGMIGIVRLAQQPDKLPWLASFVYPNPAMVGAEWIASFEQALTVVLIEMATERPKPRGFGLR